MPDADGLQHLIPPTKRQVLPSCPLRRGDKEGPGRPSASRQHTAARRPAPRPAPHSPPPALPPGPQSLQGQRRDPAGAPQPALQLQAPKGGAT